jgi:LysR family hydrogen peroxide-inducible transcriptional activator
MNYLQLRDIKNVIAIAEEKSFSKAAEKLYVSQPALSQQILRLEDWLGVKLFARNSNSVTLTYAGKVFLEDGQTIVQLSDRIIKRMSDIQELKRGSLVVGVSPFYQKCYFSKVLPVFQNKFPGIKVSVIEAYSEELADLLLNGKLDLCIGALPVPPGIKYEKLFDESILIALPKSHRLCSQLKPENGCSHPLIDMAILKDEQFIFYKPGRKMWNRCMDICHEANFEPNIIFETHSCEVINAVIAQNMGVGFVPEAMEFTCPKEQQPFYCRVNSDKAKRTFVVEYLDDYLSLAAKEFIRIMYELYNGSDSKGLTD